MSDAFQPLLDFDAADHAADVGEALILDLDGYEGPLHVLLALARSQKVDLLQISITALADQYLSFVHQAKRLRFALAADYLVMAAWLTYLKSRLLLPKPERNTAEGPEPEEMAAVLAFRLNKLDAMRRAGEQLMALPQTGRDVFSRGDPEARTIVGAARPQGDLYALIQAYATQRLRQMGRRYQAAARVEAYPLEAARDHLRKLLPRLSGWTPLQRIAPQSQDDGPSPASYLASTFSAGLEMTKEGAVELRQMEAFCGLMLRARQAPGGALQFDTGQAA
jgi:segregation and condensation protein A